MHMREPRQTSDSAAERCAHCPSLPSGCQPRVRVFCAAERGVHAYESVGWCAGPGWVYVPTGVIFGPYDVLVVYEATDDTTAASVAMTIAADGAVRSSKTTRLLSGQEWTESLRKAQGSQYRPAR